MKSKGQKQILWNLYSSCTGALVQKLVDLEPVFFSLSKYLRLPLLPLPVLLPSYVNVRTSFSSSNSWSNGVLACDTRTSGSVNPDGPAPKGMLANYALFLTTVVPRSVNQQIPPLAPPLAVPSLPLSPASLPLPSELPSPLERSSFDRQGRGGGGWGGDAWGTMVSARVEEADVRDALVDRDMGESILCRWRYRILPGFSPGDCPYVVSPLGCLMNGFEGSQFL